jgi:cobalt-zinc-cadmium resistance protein CzcA
VTGGDLGQIVLASRTGTPVMLRDVARIETGPMQRQGAVLRDGRGETVSGMVIMLKGENGKRVIERVKERLASLYRTLGWDHHRATVVETW